MESIGGYRIIRKLGSGTRSDVFLGHAGLGPGGEPHLAAIKVFRADAPLSGIDAEIAALSRLGSPHIVRLDDLASGPDDRPCLILQRLEPGGLARVFAGRGSLAAGEAVTILAPLAEAVASMHREGVVHGKVNALAVLFDEAGAPVLTGFGACGFIDGGQRWVTPAALDLHAGVGRDLDALTLLVSSVVARVHDSRATMEEFSRWLRLPRADGAQYTTELQERLFALAAPIPVGFTPDVQRAPSPPRLGTVGAVATSDDVLPADARGADQGAAAGLRTLRWHDRLPPHIETLVVRSSAWVDHRLAAVRAATRGVRRRVWLVAGLGSTAVVVAVALVPMAGSGGRQPQPAVLPTGSPTDFVLESSAVLGDDPVAAARELLTARASCLLDRSILCLDGVDQPDSAAWAADAARIRDVQQGAELQPDGFDSDAAPAIIDRMGDSALVALLPAQPTVDASGSAVDTPDTTASVLMIRTEAGWRFRSLLAGAEPVG